MRRAAPLLAALACLAGGAGLAQDWTIQTVAVRDLREADSIAQDLVRLGFDAYTEFSMGEAGLQWVRVRVGCFHGRRGAEAMAALLRADVTREAVVVERSPSAPARGCLRRVVGFVAPADLVQPEPGVPMFVVEVAGVRGVVRFLEGRWRVLQEPATEALAPGEAAPQRFRQVTFARRDYVRVRHPDGEFYVCPGRLLAQADGAAVVEDDGVVLACVWSPPAEVAEAP